MEMLRLYTYVLLGVNSEKDLNNIIVLYLKKGTIAQQQIQYVLEIMTYSFETDI